MASIVDKYNLIIGGVITILTSILGVHWYIFVAYLVLNLIDWLTGCYKARLKKVESSDAGLKGIVKKLGSWVIVAVAFLISIVFVKLGNEVLHIQLDFLLTIGWFTLACLMINEARSILENLVECGYAVPSILTKGLVVAEDLIDQEEENMGDEDSEDEDSEDEDSEDEDSEDEDSEDEDSEDEDLEDEDSEDEDSEDEDLEDEDLEDEDSERREQKKKKKKINQKKATPKKDSQKKATPKKDSQKKATPKKDSQKKATSKKDSQKKTSHKKNTHQKQSQKKSTKKKTP